MVYFFIENIIYDFLFVSYYPKLLKFKNMITDITNYNLSY